MVLIYWSGSFVDPLSFRGLLRSTAAISNTVGAHARLVCGPM